MINEHKAKINTKTMKVLQNDIDKGMKKQLRDLVVNFAKTTQLEIFTKSLCKAYLIAEVKDDCGDISRYDNHINDVMVAELEKKMGKQLAVLKNVVKRTLKKRIRADLATYLKDFDIFNPSPIILPDEITVSEREE